MSVWAYGSIRVPRVGSTSRGLLEHRWYIGGMKLASFPFELAKPLLQKAYTRDAYAPLPGRGPAGAQDRTSSPKAIPERCQGASIADYLSNQRLFWTALEFRASHLPRRSACGQTTTPVSAQKNKGGEERYNAEK
jgi:hypothetical protein